MVILSYLTIILNQRQKMKKKLKCKLILIKWRRVLTRIFGSYDEFHPFLYKQFANRKYKEFPTFDSAVDEFFSAIESQKLELKTRRQEEAALKKLDSVRKEQEKRVNILLDQQITNVRKAQLIELNLQLVDAAITIIRNAVASQMDWQDLNDLVKEEKRRENPIALIIETLKLDTNQLTLVLT